MTLKLTSTLGIFLLIGFAWICSENRGRFPWRPVVWGVALQFGFGAFILHTAFDARVFGGCRAAINKFIGFANEGNQLVFGPLAKEDRLSKASLDPRSYVLTTYALCGFANLASVAIQIGGIGALVPARRGDLATLGMKAMVGGLLASSMTACVCGVLL